MARGKREAPAHAAATPATSEPAKRKRKRRGNRTNAAAIKRRENMKAACDYRKQGYTFAEIAEELKVSTATAYRLVSDAIKEIPEEAAAEVRSMIIGRLDFLTARTFEILADGFEPGLVDVVLKLDDRRARLLGLYKSSEGASDRVFEAVGDRFARMLEADRPILMPDEPIPANPIL